MPIIDSIGESIIQKKIITANQKTKIEYDRCSDLSTNKKFIKSVNDAYKKLPLDSDLKNQFGDIDTKTAKESMEITYIRIMQFSNGNITVEIHCNSKGNKAKNFLNGHSYIINMSFDSNYTFKRFTSSVEG